MIAALSSDAIPTPPLLARAMLDLLPQEVWSHPDYRWLDPATKSGSILREAARRLMAGLAGWEPDAAKRAAHILTHMLHGSAITRVHTTVVDARNLLVGALDRIPANLMTSGEAGALMTVVDHQLFQVHGLSPNMVLFGGP